MASPAETPPDITGVDPAWKHTIDLSHGDPRWNSLDILIRQTVQIYNSYLHGKAGYLDIDPTLIKAMCWTETGAVTLVGGTLADNPDWSRVPMQFGSNAKDPGARELLVRRKARADQFLPPQFRDNPGTKITLANIATSARFNIPAGIGLLLLNACQFKYVSVPAQPAAGLERNALRRGEGLGAFATRQHTTLTELVVDNPDLVEQTGPPLHEGDQIPVHYKKPLQANQSVSFRGATMQWMIAGWQRIDEQFAATSYNGGGDQLYFKKLRYCEWIMRGGGGAPK